MLHYISKINQLDMNQAEQYKRINEELKDIRTCMFVTHTGTTCKGRPMATQEMEFNGSVWFMTDRRSNKIKEITENPQVSLQYSHSNGVTFISLSGTAKQVEDKARIKEYWSVFLKAWFDGEDDPNITLIEVKVDRAEYWDNKGGKIGALADMAIGMATGKENTLDENEVFEWK